MAQEKVTYEQAKQAAEQIREYRKNETCIIGPDWVWPTFDLEYTLQKWKEQCFEEGIANEFEEEYKDIHIVAAHNWHRYEEGPYI